MISYTSAWEKEGGRKKSELEDKEGRTEEEMTECERGRRERGEG